jgi:hypothetical protein
MGEYEYRPDAWNYLRQEFQAWLNEPLAFAIGVFLGNAGVGKTTFLEQIAKELNAHLYWITPESCPTHKDLLNHLNTYMRPTVDTLIEGLDGPGATTVPGWIVLEDWDTLMNQDRSMMGTFTQFITGDRPNPFGRRIICLSHRSSDKKFPTSCRRFYFKSLSDADICLILKHRFPSIHLSSLTYIADHCQANLHTAVEMCRFEISAVSRPPPAASAASAATRGRKKKTVDASAPAPAPLPPPIAVKLLELAPAPPSSSTQESPFQSKDTQGWFQWFSQDPWMAPLRFHENLIKEVSQRSGAKLPLYNALLDALLEWDISMGRWINEEGSLWMDLPILILSITVVLTLESHKRMKRLKYTDSELSNFTKILSQLSLHKKNTHTFFHQYKGGQYPVYECPYAWLNE